MLLPTTFTIPSVCAPRCFASRRAASVSAVSPLWEIPMTSVRSSTMGLRYRNSEAYSTSTGMRASSSSMYSPIKPACHEVPHAVRTTRSISKSSSSLRLRPASLAVPSSSRSRPPSVSRMLVGCSMISLSMKCEYPPRSIVVRSQSSVSTSFSTRLVSRSAMW